MGGPACEVGSTRRKLSNASVKWATREVRPGSCQKLPAAGTREAVRERSRQLEQYDPVRRQLLCAKLQRHMWTTVLATAWHGFIDSRQLSVFSSAAPLQEEALRIAEEAVTICRESNFRQRQRSCEQCLGSNECRGPSWGRLSASLPAHTWPSCRQHVAINRLEP